MFVCRRSLTIFTSITTTLYRFWTTRIIVNSIHASQMLIFFTEANVTFLSCYMITFTRHWSTCKAINHVLPVETLSFFWCNCYMWLWAWNKLFKFSLYVHDKSIFFQTKTFSFCWGSKWLHWFWCAIAEIRSRIVLALIDVVMLLRYPWLLDHVLQNFV